MNPASLQERLQMKREPLDKWSLREQLCLASAVARSGDQNWMSVSRALKPFGETNRPADWFHQKNCAAQYGALLANVETPKRKKRSGVESVVETPSECIFKRLLADRQAELQSLLAEEKAEYKKLQEDMKVLQSGKVSEEQLDKWIKDIEEEELKKEQEAINHAKWLKQRDLRKQEIERAWRPVKPSIPVGQKRKSDAVEEFTENEVENTAETSQFQWPRSQTPVQYQVSQEPNQAKPALSPLLTSLLKSPSQVPNITSVPSSILHTAITSQAHKVSESTASPTITSLLNSSSTAYNSVCNLAQDDIDDDSEPLNADILDDTNIKIDDLAKSILTEDDPFPEIKKEEVDDIISEIIENNLVVDPEQHLQLDGNGDININLELDELEQEGELIEDVKQETEEKCEDVSEKLQVVDPFEFQEDPVIFESPVKPSTLKQDTSQHTPLYQQQQSPVKIEDQLIQEKVPSPAKENEETAQEETIPETPELEPVPSEEIKVEGEVETPIEPVKVEAEEPVSEDPEEKPEDDDSDSVNAASSETVPENNDFTEDIYDTLNMEVKIDKTGKTRRDYSRNNKRKEEKSFDMLLAIEKAQLDSLDDSDFKKDATAKLKLENDRSCSPWTEEEDMNLKALKRRYSTCGTPVSDSLPNSPASSTAFDDDKEHRNWKKSVMLVYNRLASNKYASLFLKPITEEQAPGYSLMVYRAMDLQTIKKNIDSGVIRTSLEFKRDVMLMFTNAIMYNKTNDTVYNMALQMQQEAMEPIEILLQAEGQVDAPARRETRTSESSCKRKRMSEEPMKNKKRRDD